MDFKRHSKQYNKKASKHTTPQSSREVFADIKAPYHPSSPSAPQTDKHSIETKTDRFRKTKFRSFIADKKIIIVSIGVLIIVFAVIAAALIRTYTTPEKSDHNKHLLKPSYKTILPNDQSIDELGGWKRISPPKNDPVFAYTDKIDNIPVSVSQQPLPKSFKQETSNQVAELAKKFSATDKLVAGNTTVYIGTSSKGPQSVIFTKNNLLILIKSQEKIDNKSWIAYIESLS